MEESTRRLAGEVEAIRAAYAALNRGDVPGFVRMFHPQIERIEEPPAFPAGRVYRGLAAVMEHVSEGRGRWTEGSCEPRRFIVAGERVVVLVDVRVRLNLETDFREGRTADVYTFRHGKAIEFRTFGSERQALEWAGADASGADKLIA